MSRDWKEPNATWQPPNDQRWDDALEEIPPHLYEQDEVDEVAADAVPSSFPPDELAEDDTAPEPFFTRFEGLWKFGQQISPILIPLIFGGMTFLFILSMTRTRFSYLHPSLLWPIILVLMALAVLQGMMLYYAGANNVFWSLGVILGFLLFLLVGCFTIFGPLPTGILLAIFGILAIVTARFYMRPIPEGSVDIVYSFGKYSRSLYPGLNFVLPWEWIDCRLNTRERQWTCPEQTIFMSRDEDIHLKATISYQLMAEDAYLAIVQVEDWEENLHDLFVASLQNVAKTLTPDDFIAWPDRSRRNSNMILRAHEDEDTSRWERINNLVFQHMQDRVAVWGVIINWVQMRDITLTPHSLLSVDTGPMASAQPATDAAEMPFPQAQSTSRGIGSDRMATPPPQPVVSPAPPVQPVAASAPVTEAASAAGKLPKEEVLIKAYKQIQSGKVRSPETIRDIASRFLAIANDPEASKNVSFDAGRAAQTLFDRAKLYEEQQASMEADYEDDEHNDLHESPTQSDWMFRPPSDDNMMAGG
ncbi:MAG: hypothetical protein NVS4B7_13490 [Ktedonobacteraceae bacterium]